MSNKSKASSPQEGFYSYIVPRLVFFRKSPAPIVVDSPATSTQSSTKFSKHTQSTNSYRQSPQVSREAPPVTELQIAPNECHNSSPTSADTMSSVDLQDAVVARNCDDDISVTAIK